MLIASVASAFPSHFYDQDTLLEAFREAWARRHYNLDRLEALHRNVMVGGRHLALPLECYRTLDSWGKANAEWIRVAREIGGEALLKPLGAVNVPVEDVSALIFVSVTGISTPSIDARRG